MFPLASSANGQFVRCSCPGGGKRAIGSVRASGRAILRGNFRRSQQCRPFHFPMLRKIVAPKLAQGNTTYAQFEPSGCRRADPVICWRSVISARDQRNVPMVRWLAHRGAGLGLISSRQAATLPERRQPSLEDNRVMRLSGRGWGLGEGGVDTTRYVHHFRQCFQRAIGRTLPVTTRHYTSSTHFPLYNFGLFNVWFQMLR